MSLPIPVEYRQPRKHSRNLVCGSLIVGVIVLVAVFAPFVTAQDPLVQSLTTRLEPPFWHEGGSWAHPLGTDQLGRDYLARLVYGARLSLMIGMSVMILSGLIGVMLGLAAGYFKGAVDQVILYVLTVRLAIPLILVMLMAVSLMGGSLATIILVLGLVKWDRFAVVTRAATLEIRERDFLAAARMFGSSTVRMLVREILPNIADAILVVATLTMAEAILMEAALSFLGLGVPPPNPSWGLMIAEGKDFMFTDWWIIGLPGTALFVLVLGVNLLGDGLRDALAVRL